MENNVWNGVFCLNCSWYHDETCACAMLDVYLPRWMTLLFMTNLWWNYYFIQTPSNEEDYNVRVTTIADWEAAITNTDVEEATWIWCRMPQGEFFSFQDGGLVHQSACVVGGTLAFYVLSAVAGNSSKWKKIKYIKGIHILFDYYYLWINLSIIPTLAFNSTFHFIGYALMTAPWQHEHDLRQSNSTGQWNQMKHRQR